MACGSTTYSFHVSDHPLCVRFDRLHQVPTSKLFSVVLEVRSACSRLRFQPFLFSPHYRALDLPTFEDDEIDSKERRFGVRIAFDSYGFHSGDEVPPSYRIFAAHDLAFTSWRGIHHRETFSQKKVYKAVTTPSKSQKYFERHVCSRRCST